MPRASVRSVLRSTPHSSTKTQHQVLVIAGLKRGLDVHELRKMVGGSLCKLSAAECSAWIERLSGKGLAHPPGCAPPVYARRRRPREGSKAARQQGNNLASLPRCPVASLPSRMISASHIDQIMRLMSDFFGGNQPAASAWFRKHWKCDNPRELGTTERAGQVIAALKRMLARRGSGSPVTCSPAPSPRATAVAAVPDASTERTG